MWWTLAAQGVPAILSAVRAAKQKREADKLARINHFPTQDVPDAVKEADQMATNNAQFGLPSATYQQGQRNIATSAAGAIGGARDRNSALQAIPYIQQQTDNANLNLGVADSNARMQKQQQLIGQKNVVGGYQQNAWDWNKKQRYIQNAAAIRGLIGASRENFNNAIDRTAGAALGAASEYGNNGGFSRRYDAGDNTQQPIYSNGYGADDQYGDFQTEFE